MCSVSSDPVRWKILSYGRSWSWPELACMYKPGLSPHTCSLCARLLYLLQISSSALLMHLDAFYQAQQRQYMWHNNLGVTVQLAAAISSSNYRIHGGGVVFYLCKHVHVLVYIIPSKLNINYVTINTAYKPRHK